MINLALGFLIGGLAVGNSILGYYGYKWYKKKKAYKRIQNFELADNSMFIDDFTNDLMNSLKPFNLHENEPDNEEIYNIDY